MCLLPSILPIAGVLRESTQDFNPCVGVLSTP